MVELTWLVILSVCVVVLFVFQIYKNITFEKYLDNLYKEIREIKAREKEKERLMRVIYEQQESIGLMKKDLAKLERDLKIFTEIDEDSKRLNSAYNKEETDKKVDEILKSLNTKEDAIESNSHSKIEMDSEQKAAYSQMEITNENFFITGKAGTGKSFLLEMFAKGTKKKVLRLAPTGVSALNIDGATIHSVFGFHNLENLEVDEIKVETLKLSPGKKLVLKEVDTIILDEISMVRADTFDKINRILQIVNNSSLLFGGKQMLLFGDVFQLPPIASKNEMIYLRERYGNIFFFDSDSYKAGSFNFIELITNHRQQGDKEFFDILNRIREGNIKREDFSRINSRVVEDSVDLRRITRLYPKRQDADTVNQEELEKIPAKEYTFSAIIEINKSNNQNLNLENCFQVSTHLRLKKGALVMLTKNDPGHRWVNGTLGIVSKIDDAHIFVTIKGIEYEIKPEAFEQREAFYKNSKIEYEVVLGIVQYPLVLAYAITIHKSQGSTYPRIVCDPHDCFAPGQAYVALSRCESLNGLNLLRPLTGARIKVDSHVKEFYLNYSKGSKAQL